MRRDEGAETTDTGIQKSTGKSYRDSLENMMVMLQRSIETEMKVSAGETNSLKLFNSRSWLDIRRYAFSCRVVTGK